MSNKGLSDTPFQTVKCLGRAKLLFKKKKEGWRGGEGKEEEEKNRGGSSPGESSPVLVLKVASPTRTKGEAWALAEPGCESGRQQMERDSKYICFHRGLLFSVLTAIKTTRNQPHFSFGSSD